MQKGRLTNKSSEKRGHSRLEQRAKPCHSLDSAEGELAHVKLGFDTGNLGALSRRQNVFVTHHPFCHIQHVQTLWGGETPCKCVSPAAFLPQRVTS